MSTDLIAKPSLTLTRRLAAAPEKVYAAWTDPPQMMRWWGMVGGKTLRAETDLRVGGRFHVGFRNPDGVEHNVSGRYRELVPNRKLVFTWAWRSTPERESVVTVALAPVTLETGTPGTLLTLTHEQFFDDAARDAHRGGWIKVLDSLERFISEDRT